MLAVTKRLHRQLSQTGRIGTLMPNGRTSPASASDGLSRANLVAL